MTAVRTRPVATLAIVWLTLLLGGWAIGAAVTAAHWRWDTDVVNALRLSGGSAATIARVVTFLGSAWLVIPIAIAAGAGLWLSGRRRPARFLAVAIAGAIALTDAIKPLVDRSRPAGAHLVRVYDASWPSGHTATACAVYASLAVVAASVIGSRTRRIVLAVASALLIVAVAASRVLLGVHYATDVVAGAALAGLWVAAVRHWLGAT